jgi:hypothetical protein
MMSPEDLSPGFTVGAHPPQQRRMSGQQYAVASYVGRTTNKNPFRYYYFLVIRERKPGISLTDSNADDPRAAARRHFRPTGVKTDFLSLPRPWDKQIAVP